MCQAPPVGASWVCGRWSEVGTFMNNPECGGGATNVYEYGVVMSMSDHRHYWWLLSLSPPPHSNKLNTYLLLKHTINTLHIL